MHTLTLKPDHQDFPLPAKLPEPCLSTNAETLLNKRYLQTDDSGTFYETPRELFWRVASYIAAGEADYGASTAAIEILARQFYDVMTSLEFLPNSPTLMNAGRSGSGQLSACFVLPVADSLESIYETLKHAALIHQGGGGTGFCFSSLRPQNETVGNARNVSAGPVSFMEAYNGAIEVIKQGGIRQGANIGILRIDHPDIEAFISAKDDLRKVTGFNISVAIPDAFMQALAGNEPWTLRHPVTKEAVRTIDANALFDRIVDCAWRTGEPGLLFIDRVNAENPTPALGDICATNPCGEVPLLPYEACNLGSINLNRMLNTDSTTIDWQKLAETVTLAVRFLDNVITQNRFPIPQIAFHITQNRKIGLGVMGWADCLYAMNLAYDAPEAVTLGRDVAAWIAFHAKKASLALAKERSAFPAFPESRYAQTGWLTSRYGQVATFGLTPEDWQALEAESLATGFRNATTTCIAPTGSISILANTSGGIEPVFALAYTRNVLNNSKLTEVHPQLSTWLKQSRLPVAETLKTIQQTGSVQAIESIPEAIQKRFVTALDISPEAHVNMQAVFQAYTDNGVSKTVNFNESASREAIKAALILAHQNGIKGLTVYRNNSRTDQPMTVESNTSKTTITEAGQCLTCD